MVSSLSSEPHSHAGMMIVNLIHFGRLLRASGMPIGTARILQAIEAIERVGFDSKDDVFWCLHAVLVDRAEHRHLFTQAFNLFWRNPELIKRLMTSLLTTVEILVKQEPLARRLKEALRTRSLYEQAQEHDAQVQIECDATLTWSSRESLAHKDFEQMSEAEIHGAQEAIRQLRLPVCDRPSRRFKIASSGSRVNWPSSLRRMMRSGGQILNIVTTAPRLIKRPVVMLCDISGSMDCYARMMLHFMYRLMQQRKQVHGFVFGTRLTCITRDLRSHDVDITLEKVSRLVCDWSGGTQIGTCLHYFNRDWGRRVLGQGAIVILISDGLDHNAGERLSIEVERLQKSCRRLIWVNPLLRYARFMPIAAGIRAILPHVDDFRPIHNLSSLRTLATILSQEPNRYQGDKVVT